MPQAFKEIIFSNTNQEQQEILLALLSNLGYDSFLQEENLLKAYVLQSDFNAEELAQIASAQEVSYTIGDLEQKNWNEEWEKNYEPVIVNDKVAVRAHFHEPIVSSACNIIITPQMSFGTGHHSTTKLMLQLLSDMQLKDSTVFDYGCGTGVLGIYTALQGASLVHMCDIDDNCVDNTTSNIALNNADNCSVVCANISDTEARQYDIVIANINLNILTDNMQAMAERVASGGHLLLSGFFTSDAPILESYGKKYDLTIYRTCNELNWCALHMVKN
jgi:ribosomal protein L11 methyltransferase